MKKLKYIFLGALLGGLGGILIPAVLFYSFTLIGLEKSGAQGLSFLPLFLVPLGIILGASFGYAFPKIIKALKSQNSEEKELTKQQFEQAWQKPKNGKS